ncbi:hypothetical protein BKA59DRAFT_470359 [Fusarium tricinctum]|uniref:Uncharacterized protein n=1 Tax=Fusarium tricinctum TaxID=61284 RepID=A0A8K0S211_9HYPO|nr:hypothetical protein BKA59DRAFT_470359 [Fusarium tricinctum]
MSLNLLPCGRFIASMRIGATCLSVSLFTLLSTILTAPSKHCVHRGNIPHRLLRSRCSKPTVFQYEYFSYVTGEG